jgi:hypothetical protein
LILDRHKDAAITYRPTTAAIAGGLFLLGIPVYAWSAQGKPGRPLAVHANQRRSSTRRVS